MKARIMNQVVEIPEERMGRGVREIGTGHASQSGRHPAQQGVTVGTGQPRKTVEAPSPLPGWPKPKDKWNYSYAQFLELEKQAGRVAYWIYEPWSMWLPGGVRYKPDFLVVYPEGLERKPELVEVKGYSKNLRDGITRYTIAAAIFLCFDWKMVKRKGHGWEEYTS